MYNENRNELAKIKGGYLDIGINDTMKDLFVNFIGAIVFCIFGYFHLITEKNNTIKNFVPTKGNRKFHKNVENKLKELTKKINLNIKKLVKIKTNLT